MRCIAGIGFCLLFISCNYFRPGAKPQSIARVNDNYLFREDIKGIVPVGTSKEDSVLMVRNFMDRWASQKLLMHAAELNIGAVKKAEFDALIKQYQVDLYTKAYLEGIVSRSADTVIPDQELEDYYNKNKENFRTTGMLVRLRYLNVPKNNPKFAIIRSKFFDYRKSDRKFWDTYALQLKSFAFNDSVWVQMGQVCSKLPFINPDNCDEFIRPGKSIEHNDPTGVYLIKIRDVVDKDKIGPFEYLKPTLKEVLINKRKLELIKKFEKDITDDAIKDKKYEVYK